MPKSDKQRNNLCHNVRPGINPLQQPSQELQATEFIRKTLVNKETELERFRQGDVGYISELLEVSRKAGRHPARYRRAGTMTDKFNQAVCDIIVDLFNDTELPYRIEHWNIRDQYKGLGLFATRSTKYSGSSNALKINKAMRSFSGRHRRASDTTAYSSQSGLRTQHQLEPQAGGGSSTLGHTKNERIWLKARFAIRGRLMFANHKPNAPFHFSQLTWHSPRHHTARVIGKVNYRATDADKIVRKGQQIWVYYGEGVTFA
ncbi:hypothetical protein QFC21_007034 [Naganishia friedmannii]|uniref:Uncharacterized protein n=1 Tax=Naganishia friedmannii TaxID=89922 RepID=A0ACC2UZ74_9TREE|nr:hypothetical protein QFC21_007034 [Naganishia friedmannii]